jgi:hypothetical protein
MNPVAFLLIALFGVPALLIAMLCWKPTHGIAEFTCRVAGPIFMALVLWGVSFPGTFDYGGYELFGF